MRLLLQRIAGVAAALVTTRVLGVASSPATQPAPAPPSITLNFPENVDLKTIVDYVSQRLNFNVLYREDELTARHVTIRTPLKISPDALPDLLESLLRESGLTLVDAEQPGWKRVIPLRQVKFIPVKNADPGQLASALKQILLARVRSEVHPGSNTTESTVDVTQDRRTGQLVVTGPSDLLEEAERVVRELDIPVTEQQSPIRFYKLANATAADVLETIRALEGEGAEPQGQIGSASAGASRSAAAASVTSPLRAGAASGTNPAPGVPGVLQGAGAGPAGAVYGEGSLTSNGAAQATPPAESAAPAAGGGFRTRNATVAADPNTNSIIVIAEPSVQKLYEQIVKALDKRRPQVLIEATVVTLDTSNGFTFGVELSGGSHPGKSQAVTFSSFGFSTPDPNSGRLALSPGVGFNGAIIGSDVAEVIIRALATSSRARVTSAPRILVNDNATGTLSSLVEQPYTTTAIGNTISTTSFGGYAQAGTVVTLTPHISESDYLQLEYQITLSSFTSAPNPSSGIPPGVQQDSVQSKVTIPDGSTIVAGGLNRTNVSHAVQSIPFLNQIPIVKDLTSRKDDANEKVTLFVFLRPIILRDDEFEDLKFLSDRDLKLAGLPQGMPQSAPLPIR